MPVTLITGANRGIGLEFSRQYAANGWQVFATCRQPDAAAELKALARTSEGAVRVLELDAVDIASARRAASQLDGVAIDLLINNAGVMGARNQTFGNVDYDSWAEVLNVNTLGPLRVAESFVEQVARSERRLIVTISSAMGSIQDNTSGGSIAYRSSKAAVNMAMRSAAIDLASRKISCVVVHPGWVQTDMGGPNALVSAQDSVSRLRVLIDSFGIEHSGRFYNYDGNEFPW